MNVEGIGSGYEEQTMLSSLIWEAFGGRGFVSGDRGYDIIGKMIDDI